MLYHCPFPICRAASPICRSSNTPLDKTNLRLHLLTQCLPGELWHCPSSAWPWRQFGDSLHFDETGSSWSNPVWVHIDLAATHVSAISYSLSPSQLHAALWKFTQISAMQVLCSHLITFFFFPSRTAQLYSTVTCGPFLYSVCRLRILEHSKETYARFIYHSQRSPEDTNFIANIGWINLFINIDGYWCHITGYSKGDCLTSL